MGTHTNLRWKQFDSHTNEQSSNRIHRPMQPTPTPPSGRESESRRVKERDEEGRGRDSDVRKGHFCEGQRALYKPPTTHTSAHPPPGQN